MVAQLIRLTVAPEWREETMRRLALNVIGSRGEPGCLRFDAAVAEDDPATIWVWEIFIDRAALDAHYTTPHFTAWKAWSSALPDGAILRERMALRPLL